MTVATREYEDFHVRWRRQYLTSSGMPKEEIDKMELDNIEDEDFVQIIGDFNKKKRAENGKRQRVISSKEVKKYIEDGWEFVSSLPDGDIIVKLP